MIAKSSKNEYFLFCYKEVKKSSTCIGRKDLLRNSEIRGRKCFCDNSFAICLLVKFDFRSRCSTMMSFGRSSTRHFASTSRRPRARSSAGTSTTSLVSATGTCTPLVDIGSRRNDVSTFSTDWFPIYSHQVSLSPGQLSIRHCERGGGCLLSLHEDRRESGVSLKALGEGLLFYDRTYLESITT